MTSVFGEPKWSAECEYRRSIYEVLIVWAYANGWLPFVTFHANPGLVHRAVQLDADLERFHFYWIHRPTHWKPLYRAAHYLHQRNVNGGPWSGLAMRPIKHSLYFTRWLILLVVPEHPVHLLYLMQRTGFGPARSHTVFDALVVSTSATPTSPSTPFINTRTTTATLSATSATT